mmetsp:Transcript_89721/g.290317  ORF Transcript_89721/g.290317 Transcript_89721/m.290317 type:complete len:273 (-) Transcript_89721:1138-1956(-)
MTNARSRCPQGRRAMEEAPLESTASAANAGSRLRQVPSLPSHQQCQQSTSQLPEGGTRICKQRHGDALAFLHDRQDQGRGCRSLSQSSTRAAWPLAYWRLCEVRVLLASSWLQTLTLTASTRSSSSSRGWESGCLHPPPSSSSRAWASGSPSPRPPSSLGGWLSAGLPARPRAPFGHPLWGGQGSPSGCHGARPGPCPFSPSSPSSPRGQGLEHRQEPSAARHRTWSPFGRARAPARVDDDSCFGAPSLSATSCGWRCGSQHLHHRAQCSHS